MSEWKKDKQRNARATPILRVYTMIFGGWRILQERLDGATFAALQRRAKK
jgi:hypothetical protein